MFFTVFTPPFKIDDFYPWRSKPPLCVGTVPFVAPLFLPLLASLPLPASLLCWRPCCLSFSAVVGVPELTGVHAVAAIPALTDDQCHAIAGFPVVAEVPALQMKGQWESSINVWFPLMYSQKLNCYFQNRINMFCLPVPTLIYLWEIYVFPGSFCLFCCREICGPILGIYQWLTDIWIWRLGLRPRNSQKRNT